MWGEFGPPYDDPESIFPSVSSLRSAELLFDPRVEQTLLPLFRPLCQPGCLQDGKPRHLSSAIES